MEVFLPIAQVFINPVEILLLSAIVGVLSGLFGENLDLEKEDYHTFLECMAPSFFGFHLQC